MSVNIGSNLTPSVDCVENFHILLDLFFSDFAFSILSRMDPLDNPESLMTVIRKRQREDKDTSDFMTILAGAILLLTGQGNNVWFPRRKIQRAAGGAMGSTMWGYYNDGDEQTFLYNFRMTKDQLEGGYRMLAEGGHLHDS